MHAFMATVLLRMARLDTLDRDAEPEPPDGQPTQVEQTIRRGKGNAVVGTNGMGQAAFLEKALKGCKRALFLDRLHGFAEQKITAGVVGNGKRIAISFIPQHELALEVGTPQSIGSKPLGQRGAFGFGARAPLPSHQAMAVQDGVDSAASGYADIVGQLA